MSEFDERETYNPLRGNEKLKVFDWSGSKQFNNSFIPSIQTKR